MGDREAEGKREERGSPQTTRTEFPQLNRRKEKSRRAGRETS